MTLTLPVGTRGGYSKLNLGGGGPGSVCRGECRFGGSPAQTSLKIFIHRTHSYLALSCTQRDLHSFSHTIGFCSDRAIGCFAFPAHSLVSSRPHPSDYAHGLSAYRFVFLPALSAFGAPCRPGESVMTHLIHSGLSLLDESYINHRRRNQGRRGGGRLPPQNFTWGGIAPTKICRII